MEKTAANKKYLLDMIFRASVIISDLREANYELASVGIDELYALSRGVVITYRGSVLPVYLHVGAALSKVKALKISRAIECMMAFVFDVSRCDAAR